MDLDKAIKSRTSVRKFKSKVPDWRKIIECIDAARYAPMAGNNYSPRFIVVDKKEKIQKIAGACQQDFIATANYVVVVCSDRKRTTNAYGKEGENYLRQQAGAAIQNFLLKIEESGLSTCWVGFFVEDQIKRILEIPAEVQVEAVFPIGHECEKKRTRRENINIDRILYFNTYGQTQMKEPKKLEV